MKLNGSAHKMILPAVLLPLAFCLSPCGEAADGPEKLPPNAKLVRLEAQPACIALNHPYEYRQLLLLGQLDSGERIDLMRMARIELSKKVADISPRGLVRPLADGDAEVKFTVADQTVVVSIHVTGQKTKYEPSFVRDVMPMLSKVGCNAGTCHGAQRARTASSFRCAATIRCSIIGR